ncbi:MAG: cupin domain-containing protein [Methylovirgula sp.]
MFEHDGQFMSDDGLLDAFQQQVFLGDEATRRAMLLAPLLAALPLALSSRSARASEINPAETQVVDPGAIKWAAWTAGPPKSAAMATLYGGLDKPGPYLVLMKWYPGYMSAPHSYVTDRICMVMSGTWWVNSGADFDPAHTVPVPTGGFVRRVAHTPHYDGVKEDGNEPAVIAIFGIAPVDFKLVDPNKPSWRRI